MTSLTSVGFGNIAANTKSEQEQTFKIFYPGYGRTYEQKLPKSNQ